MGEHDQSISSPRVKQVRDILWPTSVALLARVAYLSFAPQRELITDDAFYWETAQALAETGRYSFAGEPTTDFMPGFPLLVAAVIRTTGPDLEAVRAVLALLSVVAVPVVMLLAGSWFGTRVGRWTGWFFALFPPFVFFSSAVLTETCAILVVGLHLLTAERLRRYHSFWLALTMGLTYAGLVYLKPEMFVLGPAYVALALLKPALLSRRSAFVMLAVGLTSLAPWAHRNWIVFHEVIPLKATGGVLVYYASHHPPILEVTDPRAVAARSVLEIPGKPGATGRNYARAGIRRILHDPWPYLRDCLTVRAVRLFVGSQSEASPVLSRSFPDLLNSQEHVLLSIKTVLLIVQTSISLVGLGFLLMHRSPETGLARWHLLCNAAVYVALLGIPRYSLVLMPILVPHAMAALEVLVRGSSGIPPSHPVPPANVAAQP